MDLLIGLSSNWSHLDYPQNREKQPITIQQYGLLRSCSPLRLFDLQVVGFDSWKVYWNFERFLAGWGWGRGNATYGLYAIVEGMAGFQAV